MSQERQPGIFDLHTTGTLVVPLFMRETFAKYTRNHIPYSYDICEYDIQYNLI